MKPCQTSTSSVGRLIAFGSNSSLRSIAGAPISAPSSEYAQWWYGQTNERLFPCPSATSIARCWQTADIARSSRSMLRAMISGSPTMVVVK